jgi:hypothetical protein
MSTGWEGGIPSVTRCSLDDAKRLCVERLSSITCNIADVVGVVSTNKHGKPGCMFRTKDGKIHERVYFSADVTFLRWLNSATGDKPKFIPVGKFVSVFFFFG